MQLCDVGVYVPCLDGHAMEYRGFTLQSIVDCCALRLLNTVTLVE